MRTTAQFAEPTGFSGPGVHIEGYDLAERELDFSVRNRHLAIRPETTMLLHQESLSSNKANVATDETRMKHGCGRQGFYPCSIRVTNA